MVSKGKDVEFSNYVRNGSGRDNFIASNNGGNYANYYEPGRGLIYGGNNLAVGHPKKVYDHKKMFSSGKHSNYVADGSGRDSYIHLVNGGIYPE